MFSKRVLLSSLCMDWPIETVVHNYVTRGAFIPDVYFTVHYDRDKKRVFFVCFDRHVSDNANKQGYFESHKAAVFS